MLRHRLLSACTQQQFFKPKALLFTWKTCSWTVQNVQNVQNAVQNALQVAILRYKINFFLGRGHNPSPDPYPSGEGTPFPHTLPHRRLDSRAYGARPRRPRRLRRIVFIASIFFVVNAITKIWDLARDIFDVLGSHTRLGCGLHRLWQPLQKICITTKRYSDCETRNERSRGIWRKRLRTIAKKMSISLRHSTCQYDDYNVIDNHGNTSLFRVHLSFADNTVLQW